MKGPYFNTEFNADVRVLPNQMNNNIVENIKNNLLKKYSNRCFENYGYIEKVYDINNDIKGGLIRAEDNTASSVYRVNFKCRICHPVSKSIIVAKIVGINNVIIVAENGPIKFIIGSNHINNNNIQYRKSAYYPVNSNGDIINKPIQKGTYVMVKVLNKKIVKNKRNIIAIGSLESVIPDTEVTNAIKDQYESEEKITSDELLELDNKFNDENYVENNEV